VKRRLAEWLRHLANRVDRESAYYMFPAVFTYVPHVGRVITETDGIKIRPPMTDLGCPLFYKADLYDHAWKD
jgi:hypothetical protein